MATWLSLPPPMPSPFSHSCMTTSHLKSPKPDSELLDCLPSLNWLTAHISANTLPLSNSLTHPHLCMGADVPLNCNIACQLSHGQCPHDMPDLAHCQTQPSALSTA